MRIATGESHDKDTLERFYLLGDWHEGARVDVQWHLSDVSETKLATGPSAETKDFTSVCRQHHCVHISTRGEGELMLLEGCDTPGDRLVRVAVLIGWEA